MRSPVSCRASRWSRSRRRRWEGAPGALRTWSCPREDNVVVAVGRRRRPDRRGPGRPRRRGPRTGVPAATSAASTTSPTWSTRWRRWSRTCSPAPRASGASASASRCPARSGPATAWSASRPNLGWVDEPFTDLLAQRLGRPVVTGNDANLGVLAEHMRGVAVGYSRRRLPQRQRRYRWWLPARRPADGRCERVRRRGRPHAGRQRRSGLPVRRGRLLGDQGRRERPAPARRPARRRGTAGGRRGDHGGQGRRGAGRGRGGRRGRVVRRRHPGDRQPVQPRDRRARRHPRPGVARGGGPRGRGDRPRRR